MKTTSLAQLQGMTPDDFIDISSTVDGGAIWVMPIDCYRHIRSNGEKDCNGKALFVEPELSGYGTLLGRKISIIDIDYFGLARI